MFDDDEIDVPIPLPRDVRAWLAARAVETGKHPRDIAAAVIRDVVRDDEAECHGVLQ